MTPDEFAAEKLAGRIAPEANYRDGYCCIMTTILRRTSVYTLRVARADAPPRLLDDMKMRCRYITASHEDDDGVTLRWRVTGGDSEARMQFSELIGDIPATLHTGVGVNRREVCAPITVLELGYATRRCWVHGNCWPCSTVAQEMEAR